jgi:hypothetical protein
MAYSNTTLWVFIVADEVPRLPRVESAVSQVLAIQLTLFLQLLHSVRAECHASAQIIPIQSKERKDSPLVCWDFDLPQNTLLAPNQTNNAPRVFIDIRHPVIG